jgi:hypothetical protein
MRITELLEMKVTVDETEEQWLIAVENESLIESDGIVRDAVQLNDLSNAPVVDIPSLIQKIRTSDYWCTVGKLREIVDNQDDTHTWVSKLVDL